MVVLTEKRLTIICISRNRHPFLKRVILAYSQFNYHLVIADDSCDKWDWPETGRFGLLTWEYFSSSDSSPGNSYVNRFFKATQLVTTEFVCLLDDQEVIFPIGLESAIQELRLNLSISCAGGTISTLVRSDDGGIVLGRWGRRSDHYSVTLSTPIERMRQVIFDTRTANLCYQVMRKDLVIDFAKKIQKLNFQFHSAIEIFLALYLLKHGKWSMGGYPYWIRVMGPPNKSEVVEHMTTEEIQWITESLYDGKSELEDRICLAKELEDTWGRSRSINNKSVQELNWFVSLSNKLETRLKQFVKKIPYLREILIKLLRKPQKYISLKELFESQDLLSHENLLEVAHFEAVLRTYPEGIR